MTQAKAQEVTSALIGAGYDAVARVDSSDNWTVVASSGFTTVAASVVSSFATTHGVGADVSAATFK